MALTHAAGRREYRPIIKATHNSLHEPFSSRDEGNNFGERTHSITREAHARKLELRRDGKALYDVGLSGKVNGRAVV